MKRKKVTGIALSDLLDVTENTISEWRKASFAPEGDRLDKLAAALGVTAQWLVYGDRPASANAALNQGELRGYAIAVRDMLENARILQQRVIDGLDAFGGAGDLQSATPDRINRARATNLARGAVVMGQAKPAAPTASVKVAGKRNQSR